MKRVSITLLTLFFSTLTACEITPPRVRLDVPVGVSVQQAPGSGFCPPGQAKKGNC